MEEATGPALLGDLHREPRQCPRCIPLGAELDGTCPFWGSMQQPMRNLAIARGLEQEQDGAAEKAWFALCAHNGNTDIAEYWKGWQSLLPDASMAPSLPASEVVSIGEADKRLKRWAAYMRERYQLHGEP